LRAEQTQFSGYSEGAVHAVDGRLAELRHSFWTAESFEKWRKDHVPEGWLVQDLGAADLKHVHARRYAFQRPNATDRDWPGIAGFLEILEAAPCVSVQSAALAVRPSYAGSRQFTQCLFIAVFFFSGDDGPTLSPAA
jgi:hypothetical protein